MDRFWCKQCGIDDAAVQRAVIHPETGQPVPVRAAYLRNGGVPLLVALVLVAIACAPLPDGVRVTALLLVLWPLGVGAMSLWALGRAPTALACRCRQCGYHWVQSRDVADVRTMWQ